MSSLSAKDRVSLCRFTFADGRRCRTPRLRDNPRFCPYHAQKEARALAADTLGKDLAYFFSGNYLSAYDLSTALARLIPAVVRGDVKPKTAHTVAYLMQTLMQAIHMSQHEYGEAFGGDGWRKAIRNSVKGNHDYLFPPDPKPSPAPEPQKPESPQPQPQPAQTPVNCHSERSEEPAVSSSPAQPPTHYAPQSEIPTLSGPALSPHPPLPPTSAEFAQHVLASRNLSRSKIPTLSGPGRETGEGRAPHVVACAETGDSPASIHVSPSATTPASPGPASVHSPASGSQPTSSSPLPTAQPTNPPIQSSTGAQPSPQPPSEPRPPVAAASSAALQEPLPAAGPQTGPSGLPVLACLPPRNLGAPRGSRSH